MNDEPTTKKKGDDENDGCIWILSRTIGRVILAIIIGMVILIQAAFLLDPVNSDVTPWYIDQASSETLPNPIDFTSAVDYANQVGGDLIYDSFEPTGEDTWNIFNAQVITYKLLSGTGVWLLFMMPAYVIGVPIFVALVLRNGRGVLKEAWYILMLILVGAMVLTAAMDYIVIAQATEKFNIAGFDYLKDFGTGVFTGFVTGTALAFMSTVFEHYGKKE